MNDELNFITCLTWIKRGVGKQVPDVVTLDKDELRALINSGKSNPSSDTKDDDKEIDENENDGSDDLDQYNLDNYDEEDEDENAVSLAGLTYYSCNDEDPNLTVKDEEDDSDEEDIKIKPNDNLIVVGHGKKDDSVLDIYVYNEDDDDLYVHHDIPLPYMPLCVEWLDFDSTDSGKGNFVACGGMCPQIDVWDLDVVNGLEPEISLTKSKKCKPVKKKKKSEIAVLGLSWNKLARNVLASAYNDCTVALWDLSTGKDVTSITGFEDKVQSLVWHPFEAETLLTGSSDKYVKIFDCRAPESSIKSWICDGEVETVIWNHFDPFLCLAGTDKGNVMCFDARRSVDHVWKLDAHSDSCTGLALSSMCPGYLVTVSTDKSVKIWDIMNNEPSLVLQRSPNIGQIYCTGMSPDSAFTLACGGKHKSKPFKIMNTISSSAVQERFGSRNLMERRPSNKDTVECGKVKKGDVVSSSASTLSVEKKEELKDKRVLKKEKLKGVKKTGKAKSGKKSKQPKDESISENNKKEGRKVKRKSKSVKEDE